MKTEKFILNRIFKNALLSIFIYALPIILMFLTFYITKQRPWEKQSATKSFVKQQPK